MKGFLAVLSAFALLVAACSTHTAEESEPASSTSKTSNTSNTALKPTGHLGDTLNLTRADGSKVAVTLVQVINPATVSGDTGDADKTYLAIKLTLADTGTTPIEGDVNVNVFVVGSDNQNYTPDLDDVTECTNFDFGVFHLGAGESATGCVVFALPHGVTPTEVKYLPSAGFADDFGDWLVT